MLGLEALVAGASWSGYESNHLFLNEGGQRFEEVSGISGLDHIADGRVFALLDFDRDGWQDVALLNTNEPRFLLFRNTIAARTGAAPAFVALRLQGGNQEARPSERWSQRDGYGALVTVEVGGRRLVREHRCGEGLSAQNSSTLIVGVGEVPQGRVDAVEVRWPSGERQRIESVPLGSLLTVHEDPSRSPTGEPFVVGAYGTVESSGDVANGDGGPSAASSLSSSAPLSAGRLALAEEHAAGEAPDATPTLRLYTTTATWCTVCVSELPQFELLRSRFDSSELAMYGVPYDDAEGADELAAYRARFEPAYELLTDLDLDRRAAVRRTLAEALRADALPASVVTDGQGRILLTTWGVPTVSELAALQAASP